MKKEMTREEVAALAKCNVVDSQDCETCQARKICDNTSKAIRKHLATALLEEMDKPKVWGGAPKWVNAARVRFFVNDRNDGHSEVFSETYTREIQKTRARQIAEEATKEYIGLHPGRGFVDIVESALEKYAAELKEQ